MSDNVPEIVFKTRVHDESIAGDNPFRWQDVSTDDIFKGKKIVLFALPGAYTPTCSSTHLPGFDKNYQALIDQGVDEVYCLSVNDAFTMFQWGKHLGVENVKMLPDGNGDFSRGMGMLVKKENLGFGERSWRYSMLVEDNKTTPVFTEPGQSDNCPDDPFAVRDVDAMLERVKRT